MASMVRAGNDLWGWTSPGGREFGLIGQHDGTAFIEVLPNGTLAYLGRLPTQTADSKWRDIKVVGHHVYIVSEATDHGLQVFDLHKLLAIHHNEPVTFDIPASLVAHVSSFGNANNIIANEETHMIHIVGAEKCSGGLWVLDVSNPFAPADIGCGYEDHYVHDAQCVVYRGPHANYQGREICFLYAEKHVAIVDINDKLNPVTLSETTYEGVRYTHQGWLANGETTHLLFDDETDEMVDREVGRPAADGHTRTHILDIQNLEIPVFRAPYRPSVVATDHNQYIHGTHVYQSNYNAGLRVLDISSIKEVDAAQRFREVASFDCYPDDDEEEAMVGWSNGAWSAYPWFRSGFVLLNCIERGVFALKVNLVYE